jgi:hypothetical protein
MRMSGSDSTSSEREGRSHSLGPVILPLGYLGFASPHACVFCTITPLEMSSPSVRIFHSLFDDVPLHADRDRQSSIGRIWYCGSRTMMLFLLEYGIQFDV